MSIRQLQVPGCCKHDNPALGGYIIWSIQLLLVTEMNNMDFFKVAAFILKQVLSHHFVSAQDLGATSNMDIREKNLQILIFE